MSKIYGQTLIKREKEDRKLLKKKKREKKKEKEKERYNLEIILVITKEHTFKETYIKKNRMKNR